MADHIQFMSKAIELSTANMRAGKGGPFGAVIVKDGKIVGQGTNVVTSINDPTAHAEVVAIRDACRTLGNFSLAGCEIYSSCEPCPMCLSAIYWARLDKIYYANTQKDAARIGFDDAFLYEQVALPKSARTIPSIQISRDEAMPTFEDWMQKKDKVPY